MLEVRSFAVRGRVHRSGILFQLATLFVDAENRKQYSPVYEFAYFEQAPTP